MQDHTQDRDQDQDRAAPAAEADLLGDNARNTGTLDKLQPGREAPRGAESGEAEPGKDENQAGFVKDAAKKFSP